MTTLKDFEVDDWDVIELEVRKNNNPETGVDKCFISTDKLKAEAVKWINHFNDDVASAYTKDWIKHFFNLTEEDLKEQQK